MGLFEKGGNLTIVEVAPSNRPNVIVKGKSRAQIEEQILAGLQGVLAPFKHEPNTPETRDRMKYQITNFLKELKQQGALPREDVPNVRILQRVSDPSDLLFCEDADIAVMVLDGRIPRDWTAL